jgi:RecA-family ATPase
LGIGNEENKTNQQDQESSDVPLAGLVKVWECIEPEPRRFAIAELVPDGAVTALYGDGGQGKSYLALLLSIHSCLGIPFAGKAVEKRAVLYLDAELEATEFIRRAYKVARGLGLSEPPHGLHYYQLPGALTDPNVQTKVRLRAIACEAGFIVLDSLTMGTSDSDPKEAQPVIAITKYLETLGTVVAIDHTSKPAPGANMSHYGQFGSVFKRNGARSQIQLIQAEGSGISLIHKKANFGPRSQPINLALEFEETAVRFIPIGPDDDRMAGMEANMPALEQVYCELAKCDEGTKPENLAAILNKSIKTVQNYLSILHKQGRANPCGDGRWITVNPANISGRAT